MENSYPPPPPPPRVANYPHPGRGERMEGHGGDFF